MSSKEPGRPYTWSQVPKIVAMTIYFIWDIILENASLE